jgi:hypothetical protein
MSKQIDQMSDVSINSKGDLNKFTFEFWLLKANSNWLPTPNYPSLIHKYHYLSNAPTCWDQKSEKK